MSRQPGPAAMPRGIRVGRTLLSSPGLRDAYRKKLDALIRDMSASVSYWLLAEYKKQLPRVEAMTEPAAPLTASDASPARDMLKRLRAQSRRWRAIFDEKSEVYAKWFASRANAESTAATRSILSEMAGYTVPMRMSRAVNNALQSAIAENVNLIKSIHSEYYTQVEGIVLRGVSRGRDVAAIAEDLEKRLHVALDRARTIARDQTNKATAVIGRARMLDSGVRWAIWRHSGRSRHPRPSHEAADGTLFDLRVGLFLDGKMIFPGEEINCGCRAQPVIEGHARRDRDFSKEGLDYVEAWKKRRKKREK